MDITISSSARVSIPARVFENIQDLEYIGGGSFGEVYKYFDRCCGFNFAIKRIPYPKGNTAKEIERIRNEITINSKIFHDNVVKFYGCYAKQTDKIYIVLEYMENGSLKNKLNEIEENGQRGKDEPMIFSRDIIRYSFDICSALQFLHERRIIHRDLRADNVLLTSSDMAKIADFGISKDVDMLALKTYFGTLQVGNHFWQAPEMSNAADTGSTRDCRVDVWSFGILLLEMIYNVPPFMKNFGIWNTCNTKGPEIPTFVSNDVQELLKMCLIFDPSQRPNSREVLEHIQDIYSPEAYDIFMTHNWGKDQINHAKVGIINDELKKIDYTTWYDTDAGRMEGNLHEAMARGIEASEMALVFVTKIYQEKANGKGASGVSDNVYLEFNHCVSKLTPDKMICVVMEHGMLNDKKWRGKFGFNLSGRIYVDLTGNLNDPAYLSSKMIELKKAIDTVLFKFVEKSTKKENSPSSSSNEINHSAVIDAAPGKKYPSFTLHNKLDSLRDHVQTGSVIISRLCLLRLYSPPLPLSRQKLPDQTSKNSNQKRDIKA